MKKILALFFALLSCSPLMSQNLTWSSPPAVISSGTQDAFDPQVGIDSSGNAVAAWLENGFVHSSDQPFGGSWTVATIVSNSGASALRMIVDENGNATAVWVEGGVVRAATKLFGGSWSASTSLSSSGAATPQITVDPNGDVIAVWERNGAIESSTKPFSGSWPILPDILVATGADSPQVALGSDNVTVVAVWHAVIASQDTIFASDKLINGFWSSGQVIGNGINPQIAVDSSGNAIAVWYQFNVSGLTYTNVALRAIPKPFGGVWGSSGLVSERFGIRNPADLVARIGFDGSGNAVTFWNNSFDGATFTIESAVSADGGVNWSESLAPVEQNVYAYDLDLSVDTQGDAVAIYMLYDFFGSSVIIQASESDIAASNIYLGFPVTISQGATNNGFPRVAARISGNTLYVAAVWQNYDGVNNNIQSASATGTIIQPPTNLAVTQGLNNLGVFGEYFNVLTWDASTSPGVTQYLIFRNGLLISAVDTLQFIDNNRGQNESVVYGIAALNVDASQSITVTINFP